jgi:predicted DNA binding CopG/RHH family protein
MPNIDEYELEILSAYETGKLQSVATKSELAKFKAAARATAIKDRRVNIRLSSGDLSDIQVKALEEGVPYQTLIASVLHKYVTGRLAAWPSNPSALPSSLAAVRQRGALALRADGSLFDVSALAADGELASSGELPYKIEPL